MVISKFIKKEVNVYFYFLKKSRIIGLKRGCHWWFCGYIDTPSTMTVDHLIRAEGLLCNVVQLAASDHHNVWGLAEMYADSQICKTFL